MAKNILITGASSGLGEALALAYAAPETTLHLSGRSESRLASTARACEARGARTVCGLVDVTDREAMAEWIGAAEGSGPLDLVIANAGISAGTGGRMAETAEQTLSVFSVNLVGVLNTVLPVIEPMRARGRGQIAIMASLAGFRGMPSAPAYSASKAAVRVWGEGLRGSLAPDGIGVTVICPGFVISRITARNAFPMPFLMPAERAARIMKKGIDANRARVAYPWPMAAAAWLAAALPPAWTDACLRALPAKR